MCILLHYHIFNLVEKYPMIISTPHNLYHENAQSSNRSTCTCTPEFMVYHIVGFLSRMLLDTNCLATHAKLLHSRVSPENLIFFQISEKTLQRKKLVMMTKFNESNRVRVNKTKLAVYDSSKHTAGQDLQSSR